MASWHQAHLDEGFFSFAPCRGNKAGPRPILNGKLFFQLCIPVLTPVSLLERQI
jgi:hypothetical protein